MQHLVVVLDEVEETGVMSLLGILEAVETSELLIENPSLFFGMNQLFLELARRVLHFALELEKP